MHEPFLRLSADSQAQKNGCIEKQAANDSPYTSRPSPQTSKAYLCHPSHGWRALIPLACLPPSFQRCAAMAPLACLLLQSHSFHIWSSWALLGKRTSHSFLLRRQGKPDLSASSSSHHISPGGARRCSKAVCGLKAFSNSRGAQAHTYHNVCHSAS